MCELPGPSNESPTPARSDECRVEFLYRICEAFSRWGDLTRCVTEVCWAFCNNVPGVSCFTVYIKDDVRTLRAAAYPETKPAEEEESLKAFVSAIEGSREVREHVPSAGPVLIGMSIPIAANRTIILVLGLDQAMPTPDREFVRGVLEHVGRFIENAACSQAMLEKEIQQRTFNQLQEIRSEMIATLSHEIRTPLAGIKGYVTALLRNDVEWDEATKIEFLQVINDESDKLEKMVARILDMTAMEMGNIVMDKQPVLLPRLASDVISKIAVRTVKHRFAVNFQPDFPVVEADPIRIEEVMYNLLDNAVKYSPDGGLIMISGRVADDHVLIGVSDQGRGIAPEHLNRLFEKYFRIGSRERVRGTGLGLPIARQIIEKHGGKIWAESTLGRGTTVYFTLPFERDRNEIDYAGQ